MMHCHTPEQQRLYERGWPYVVELVDGHKDDKKPADSAANAFKGTYWGKYHVKWPRLTAKAFVGDGAPEQVVAGLFEKNAPSNFNVVRHRVFVLEALTSTDVVLEAIVRGLESMGESRWMGKSTDPFDSTDDVNPSLLAYLSGFLLLRSSKRESFTKRLEAVYDATVKGGAPEGEHGVRGGLDLALHGNAGAARALAKSHWQYWYYYLNVDDAAVHLARLADNSKSDWVPEARILFLAGEKLLPVYTSKKALRQGKRLPNILGDFGMFAHEGVLDLMIDMVGVKGAGDAPREYFEANAAWARPRLDKRARGSGERAVKAKAAMSLLK